MHLRSVDVRSGRQENLDDLVPAVLGGDHERGCVLTIARIHFDSAPQLRADRGQVTGRRRMEERVGLGLPDHLTPGRKRPSKPAKPPAPGPDPT